MPTAPSHRCTTFCRGFLSTVSVDKNNAQARLVAVATLPQGLVIF
jgi:hypothetical protein